MLTLILVISLLYSVVAIDNLHFTNFRATERHDSYLSFQNASSISFPLTLKWNLTNTGCTFSDPFMELAFDGRSIYCIANANIGPLERNLNSSIISVSIKDGTINWRSYIYKTAIPGNINTSFTGPVTFESENHYYLSILDNNFGFLYILNSSDGEILQNVSIQDSCPINLSNGNYCIQSGITASNSFNASIVFYTTDVRNPNQYEMGTILTLDANGKSKMMKATGYTHNVAQMPTICSDTVAITTNLFEKVDAFDLRNNLQHLWSYNISKTDEYGTVSDIPTLCIPRNDGYFNVLVTSLEVNVVQEKWHLIDGRNGSLINEIIWKDEYGGLPAVHVDKMLLIRNVGHDLLAFNLSSSMNANNWTQIYSVKHSSAYFDIVIIDNYILLSNATAFDVYFVDNGTFVWSYTYPINNRTFYNSKIIAGITEDNEPMVVALSLLQNTQPIQSTVWAFS